MISENITGLPKTVLEIAERASSFKDFMDIMSLTLKLSDSNQDLITQKQFPRLLAAHLYRLDALHKQELIDNFKAARLTINNLKPVIETETAAKQALTSTDVSAVKNPPSPSVWIVTRDLAAKYLQDFADTVRATLPA